MTVMPALCEFDTQAARPPAPAGAPSVKLERSIQITSNFPRPFVARPRLAHGVRVLDIGNNDNIRVDSKINHVTKGWAHCNIITWCNTILYRAIDNAIALAPGDLDILTGEHTRNLWGDHKDPASVRVNFERPFVTPPEVVVFLNRIDLDKNRNWRIITTATDIDTKGFTLNIDTWSDTIFYSARACWIAYPEDRQHIFSTSISTMDIRPWNQTQLQHSKKITFNPVEFFKTPSVFIALNYLDIDCKANLRVKAYVDNISTTGLEWHIDSWLDSIIHAAGATIIAFN